MGEQRHLEVECADTRKPVQTDQDSHTAGDPRGTAVAAEAQASRTAPAEPCPTPG